MIYYRPLNDYHLPRILPCPNPILLALVCGALSAFVPGRCCPSSGAMSWTCPTSAATTKPRCQEAAARRHDGRSARDRPVALAGLSFSGHLPPPLLAGVSLHRRSSRGLPVKLRSYRASASQCTCDLGAARAYFPARSASAAASLELGQSLRCAGYGTSTSPISWTASTASARWKRS